MQPSDAQRVLQRVAGNIEQVMRGQHAQVRKLLAAFAAGGHVLVDDFPGTGKTTLAKALAAQRDREASLRRQYVAESVARHAALKGGG